MVPSLNFFYNWHYNIDCLGIKYLVRNKVDKDNHFSAKKACLHYSHLSNVIYKKWTNLIRPVLQILWGNQHERLLATLWPWLQVWMIIIDCLILITQLKTVSGSGWHKNWNTECRTIWANYRLAIMMGWPDLLIKTIGSRSIYVCIWKGVCMCVWAISYLFDQVSSVSLVI